MKRVSKQGFTYSGKTLISLLLLVVFSQLPAFADHVHHLWYNNSIWQDQDLTVLTGGAVNYGAAVAAFYTTPNDQLHVYYADTSGYVHQLYYNNTSWSDENLTAELGAPLAYQYGLSGFSIGNYQYVFYISAADQHVHQMNYVNNWTDTDITALGGGVAANPVIVAFPTKPNNQFHVFYQDSLATDMHQLYYNGSSWSDSNLTAWTGAYCPGGQWWAGFATGNLQHVLCPGYGTYSNNLDLLHIYYNNSSWVYEDITYRSGGPELAIWPDSAVTGFAAGKVGEVYAITTDEHIHQYTYAKGRWSDLDLTANENAPTKTYGGMVGFITPGNNQYHIYLAPDSDIYQLYYNGSSWGVENLTGGAGQADYYGAMGGFAIGNQQHVFYFDTQN